MNLSGIKQVLRDEGIRLTKALGQNFLHDIHHIDRIVRSACLSSSDCVMEIGPGLGALTQPLLDHSPTLLAIEKDRRLYDLLRKRFSSAANFTLLHADALDYLRLQKADWSSWKLVSNLPYSVASPILVEMAKAPGAPALMAVTLQLEVALRLMAQAGEPDFGVLTLLVQARYEPRGMFKIPARCFFPVPEVDSAFITLARRITPLVEPAELPVFEKIVKRAFSQRRKIMMKLLRTDWSEPSLQSAYSQLGLSPKVRAERTTLEEFVQLTKLLGNEQSSPDYGRR